MNKENNNKSLYLIIIFLCLLILGLGGYIIYDKILSNKEKSDYGDIENTNNTDNISALTGKIDINDYCPKTDACKKEIGNIIINNDILKLSVDLKNINNENASGFIKLGSKEIDISSILSHYGRLDGFEVYNNYLILYYSNFETMVMDNKDCQVRAYEMSILDSDLNEISGLSGYTKNNPLKDFKIENDYLYYYALKGMPIAILTYEKINFNDLLNQKYENTNLISSINECQYDQR